MSREEWTGYPWSYLVVLFCLAGGAFTAPDTGPSEAELQQREHCAPIVWHDGMDQRGWDLLREQGYVGRADDGMDAIYPPGCEGVTP